MNEKLEQLFTEWKQAHFDQRATRTIEDIDERKAARQAARQAQRSLGSQMTDEFYTITDVKYLKDFTKRKEQFSTAFTFTREATCEEELNYELW